ncbi:hypothetical protein [Paenibacillus cremeus]|uniref:Uncharacterized protein n=1 Tax=Paenibacillus cremeus TaxID=2163881 RepID=A0A559JRA1_9BACL|nr:hypothetical protein [Paenibacillus cremeus]TVY02408.1 hypothetical protein FPZ49_31615 [Paenibacillus cremeus]
MDQFSLVKITDRAPESSLSISEQYIYTLIGEMGGFLLVADIYNESILVHSFTTSAIQRLLELGLIEIASLDEGISLVRPESQ